MTRAMLAKALRRVREGAGLSQSDIARATGLPTSSVSRYESGLREAPLDVVAAWASACGRDLRLDFPLAGTPDPAAAEIAALRAQVANLQSRIDAAAALLTEKP